MDYSSLKLVIWDLDDTFWKGTLSEGPISFIEKNVSIVRSLDDHGIVNTICSKNDKQPVLDELHKIGLEDVFVFKSIDWTPKGPRIAKLIKDMGLRPVNCLFIDDNPVNCNEALHYSKDLNVESPQVLPELEDYLANSVVSDPEHQRRKRYQILEAKQKAKDEYSDNLDFLYDSDTRVEIHHDCLAKIDRIEELVKRTNQLNFTKIRSTREELVKICADTSIDTGYVTVSDRFGDYGVVGFYAVKDGVCLHFLFSCRTIGQGVEQYVYSVLGYPTLNVVGEVISMLTLAPAPAWINQSIESKKKQIFDSGLSKGRIILKGACDLKVMSEYLNTNNVIEEFTYVTDSNKWIEHQNHSVNYLQWTSLSNEQRERLLEDCVFNDKDMFASSMFDDNVAILFLSTMIEPNLGVYRRKKDGFKIAFGEFLYPLTDPSNWKAYVEGTVFTAGNKFTYEWLQHFSTLYEFEGPLDENQIIQNAEKTLDRVSKKTIVCYLLGSETPFLNNSQPAYDDRHLTYKKLNNLYRELARRNNRVRLIDFNDYINGQDDFTNNINHFQRRVYYQVATRANELIQEVIGEKLIQKSRLYLYRKSFNDYIGRSGLFQTRFWSYARKPWVIIKRLFNIS